MNNKKKKNVVVFKLMIILFISILVSIFTVGIISIAIIKIFNLKDQGGFFTFFLIGIPLIASGIITLVFSTIASKRDFKELNKFLNAMEQVEKGDFTVVLDEKNVKSLNPVYKSFNSMVKELNSIEILRTDFISSFSHEFKTPIVSIRGFAEVLKSDTLNDDEKKEYVDIIITEIDRLVHLAEQTLLLTKLESKEFSIEKTTFRLDEQIRKAILLLQNKWESKNITLTVNLETVYITNSENLLNQLWINILSNSIKYNYEGGKIDVFLKKKNDEFAEITIKDSGIGIDDEAIKLIFNKFYQEDKSRTTEGLGLGLSIVNRIIEICDGNIDVTSVKEKGTTFLITLRLNNKKELK